MLDFILVLVAAAIGTCLVSVHRDHAKKKRLAWMARPVLSDQGFKALVGELRAHSGWSAYDIIVNDLRTSRLSKDQAEYIVKEIVSYGSQYRRFIYPMMDPVEAAHKFLYWNELLAEHVALAEERELDEAIKLTSNRRIEK